VLLQLVCPPVRKVPPDPFWYQYQAAVELPSPVQVMLQLYGVSAKTVGTIDRTNIKTGNTNTANRLIPLATVEANYY